MTEDQIVEIADKADMIVNYYAFTKQDEIIRILNSRNLTDEEIAIVEGK